MSASTEKKQRQAAREAGNDRKAQAAQEEAKKKARSKRNTTIIGICAALLIVLILLLSSGFFYKHTTALTVGDRNYSPAEVNYHYAESYLEWANQYGTYASSFGLDTSAGPFALKDQDCPLLESGTWRDYFLQNAYAELAQMKGLTDYANANGLTVSEENIAQIDSQIAQLEAMSKAYGYSSADNYLEANYGSGVDTKIMRSAMLDSMLASGAYTHFTDGLTYTDEELEEHYASFEGAQDLFDFAFYYVYAETEQAEDGGTLAPTEQAMLEARMTAEAIMTSYQDDGDTEDPVERLNAAIEAEFDDASATERTRTAGSSLGDMADWLMAAERKAGDIGVVESSANNGYYVLVFLNRDDNHYPTVSVRHILINADTDENGSWSDESLAAAREEAARILAEWQKGEATEESFAALAEQYSQDAGSNTNGGLYEEIYKGQMVSEFDAFCFEGHEPGDTTIVYGSNGDYAGYHVIYFVGEGELYSNDLARHDLQDSALHTWLEEITPEYKEGPAAWLAGK